MNEEFEEEQESPKKVSGKITHSRDLVHYVNRSQTYPSNNSRSLALYIADYYNPQRGYAFPSQDQMAHDFQTHRPTVARWLKEIESTGYWVFEKNGKLNATRYVISPQELKNIEAFLKAEARNERVNNKNPRIEGKDKKNPHFVPGNAKDLKEDEYVISDLPERFCPNLNAVRQFMDTRETVKFKMPSEASEIGLVQKETIALIVSYLVHDKIVERKEVPSVSKLMIDTWLRHPETENEAFYNRFMHYLSKDSGE